MGGARDDHAAIRRLADELLPALVARLEASPLGELEVSQDGWRVRLRKPNEPAGHSDDGGAMRAAGSGASASAKSAAGKSASGKSASGRSAQPDGPVRRGERAERPAERGESPSRVVRSPAVGTFHPLAGASLGRAVRAGDVIGHVEVLGVPQEVLAPFDGTLGRLLVEPGQVVEYGEHLFRIESAGQASASVQAEAASPAEAGAPPRRSSA